MDCIVHGVAKSKVLRRLFTAAGYILNLFQSLLVQLCLPANVLCSSCSSPASSRSTKLREIPGSTMSHPGPHCMQVSADVSCSLCPVVELSHKRNCQSFCSSSLSGFTLLASKSKGLLNWCLKVLYVVVCGCLSHCTMCDPILLTFPVIKHEHLKDGVGSFSVVTQMIQLLGQILSQRLLQCLLVFLIKLNQNGDALFVYSGKMIASLSFYFCFVSLFSSALFLLSSCMMCILYIIQCIFLAAA